MPAKRKILPPTIVKREIDDSHYYWVNGIYAPATTSIIDKGAPKAWELMNYFKRSTPGQIEQKSEVSLAFGSKMHDGAEQLLMGEELNLVEDYKKSREKKTIMSFHDWFYMVNPTDFLAEHKVAFVPTRQELDSWVFNKKDIKRNQALYAGTLDFAGWIDPMDIMKTFTTGKGKVFQPKRKGRELWLIDFKTGAGIYFTYKLQVMAYKHALERMTGVKVDHVGILRLGTRHKLGFEFVEVIEDEVNIEDFMSVYKLYLKVNGGKIPPPPKITKYPDTLRIIEGVNNNAGKTKGS